MPASELVQGLAQDGLVLRGVLPFESPLALPFAGPARLWLVGAVGSSLWPAFSASAECQDAMPDPLDRWSRRIAQRWAQRLGGLALFPFGGPPHWPFQRWADQAEALWPSPLGLRLHPEHGLWHAYRFALVLPQSLQPPESARATHTSGPPQASPCTHCPRHCQRACPVSAHDQGFDLQSCLKHLSSTAGQTCMQQGCQARSACPQGQSNAYQSDHAAFHMQAFVHAHRTATKPEASK